MGRVAVSRHPAPGPPDPAISQITIVDAADRPVDIAVTRPIGETYTGRDSQLDAAIKSLLGDLKEQL